MKYDKYLNVLIENKNLNLSCEEACISFVAQYSENECDMLFNESLFFRCKNSNKWNENFYRKSKKETYYLLKIINGIDLKKHRCKNINNFIHYFKNLNSKFPVMLYTDDYYCAWTPYYMKQHGPHCILLLDINERNQSFYSLDPIYSDELLEMKFDALKDTSLFYFIEFSFCDTHPIEKEHLTILSDTVQRFYRLINKEGYCDILLNLIRLFYYDACLNINSNNYHLQDLPLLRRFKGIGKDRKNYTILLSSLSSKYNVDATNLINRCYELGELWNSLRTIIIKYTLKQNYLKLEDNSVRLLKIILSKESKLCSLLTRFYNSIEMLFY